MSQFTVTCSEELIENLEAAAKSEHRSRNNMAIVILQKYLEDRAQRHVEAELKTARKRHAAKRSRDAG